MTNPNNLDPEKDNSVRKSSESGEIERINNNLSNGIKVLTNIGYTIESINEFATLPAVFLEHSHPELSIEIFGKLMYQKLNYLSILKADLIPKLISLRQLINNVLASDKEIKSDEDALTFAGSFNTVGNNVLLELLNKTADRTFGLTEYKFWIDKHVLVRTTNDTAYYRHQTTLPSLDELGFKAKENLIF